jgi:Uma2 family endonuclease
MTTKERFYTADDLMRMPDDGKRYELVQGELVEMPPPNRGHALLSARLLIAIGSFAQAHDLGEVTGADGAFWLHTDPETGLETVRVPDVAFTTKVRKSTAPDKIYRGAPDLAVEVISPSETFTMIRRKLRDYFAYGVRRVWLVYPDARSIEVYRNAEDEPVILDVEGTLEGGDLLPGFSLKVKEVFAVLV